MFFGFPHADVVQLIHSLCSIRANKDGQSYASNVQVIYKTVHVLTTHTKLKLKLWLKGITFVFKL